MKLAIALTVAFLALALFIYGVENQAAFKEWLDKPARNMSLSDLLVMIVFYSFLTYRERKH